LTVNVYRPTLKVLLLIIFILKMKRTFIVSQTEWICLWACKHYCFLPSIYCCHFDL